MTLGNRLKVFLVGACLGGLISTVIMQERAKDAAPAAEEPQTADEVQRQAVPGILAAYRERGVPMVSDHIVASRLYPHPDDNTYVRALILRGVTDAQVLRIEETVVKSAPGRDLPERVTGVRVMAADRAVVTLAPDTPSPDFAAALRPLGYRLLRRLSPDRYLVQLETQRPETLPDALAQLSALPSVTDATPEYLDE